MADICAKTGGDISALARSLGLDPRIGAAFLKAGLGYGGACLPKDVRGLGTFAREIGAQNATSMLDVVDAVNVSRGGQAVSLVEEAVGGVEGKRVTVWGAAFKPGTDDVRDSAGLQVAKPAAFSRRPGHGVRPNGQRQRVCSLPRTDLCRHGSCRAASADVIVVVTAWPEFTGMDAAEAAAVVRGKVVVDVCQGISAAAWRDAGWQVVSLTGVPAVEGSPDVAAVPLLPEP